MTPTYLRRSLPAAFVLLALAVAEAFVLTFLFHRDAAAHEAPPSELSVTIIPDGLSSLQVSFDLVAAAERLELPVAKTAPFDSATLQRISDRIAQTLVVTLDDTPLQLQFDEAALKTDATGSVAAFFDASGSTIAISPGRAIGDSLIRFGDRPIRYIRQTETASFQLDNPSQTGGVLLSYIKAGFVHIVPMGLDHILFVIGLFLLSLKLRPLLIQVSLFTLAHSVTLALGALGLIRVPGVIVEPLIAASIVFIAAENIITRDLSRWRPYVVFAFGLLHGLGFASVLADYGLPDAEFLTALIGFNIGVEIGQLFVLAVCFCVLGYWFSAKSWYRSRITIPVSLAVGAVGLMWTVERVGGAL